MFCGGIILDENYKFLSFAFTFSMQAAKRVPLLSAMLMLVSNNLLNRFL